MKKLLLLFLSLVLTLSVYSQDKTMKLQEVTVYNVSANDCFTVENIKFDSIKPIGENISQMSWLKTLPSITYHSDNGVDAGYNYFRLRGIDQSRVNMTLNGMPLNEPEDGGFYFNNLGGLVNILDNMQVVNGSTLTKNGSSVLAGGINMNTRRITANEVNIKTYLDFYNTSGISTTITNKSAVNSLVSVNHSSTDGYRYNSYNNTKNVSYIINKQFGKFYLENIGILTNQKNGMAWIGATKEQIAQDSRTNNNTDKEYDQFINYVTQLIGKYYFNDNLILHTNVYYNHIGGKYTTDLDNLIGEGGLFMNKLRQNWVGNFSNLTWKKNNLTTDIGYNTYYFQRKHIGYDANEGYENIGYKHEVSPYLKASYVLGDLVFTGNIQYRYTDFDYNSSEFEKIKWNFINYGIGATYNINDKSNVYYSFGRNNREPSRLDMFGGLDYYDSEVFTLLDSEYVYDHEFGFRYRNGRVSVEVPFYYMTFKNELALNGLVNQQGIHLHSSANSSHRYGVELKFSYKNRLSVDVSGNLSKNKIVDYHHVLSPEQSVNIGLSYDLTNNLSAYTLFRYIGESYIDPLNEYKLDEAYQIDLGLNYNLKGFNFGLGVVNLTDKLNYTNAYMNGDTPYYFTNTPFRVNFKVNYTFNY